MTPLKSPKGIVIHHSLTKDGQTCSWDAIKVFHMTDPAYMMSDIGYHGGVEVINGVVTSLTGRPINMCGGHTKGHNNMLGFCFVGNYDKEEPSYEMLEAGAAYVRAWLTMFPHLSPHDIHKHSEYAMKTCPGVLFPWERFKSMITVI